MNVAAGRLFFGIGLVAPLIKIIPPHIVQFARIVLCAPLAGECWYVVYNANMNKTKTAKQMERHLKGISNHYRIEILLLIAAREKITLEEIVREIEANEKTVGEHTRRLFLAGLINKRYRGRFVEHSLSPYGKHFVRFLKAFQST